MYLCFIDTETTGTDPQKNGIIQIAGVITKFCNDKLEILEIFDLKAKPLPRDEINPEALIVTGTTREMLETYEPSKDVYKKIVEMFSKYCDKFNRKDKMIMVAYNAIFDYNMLRSWFEKLGDKYFGSWFHFPPIDVMNTAMMELMTVRQNLINFKLGTVAEYLNIKPDGDLHDALVDIELTKKLFEHFYFKIKEN